MEIANIVFLTAETVLSNPKALWVTVLAKEAKRVLSVIKKFSVHTVSDLSCHLLKFTDVHPTKGYIQATFNYKVFKLASRFFYQNYL